MAEKVVRAGDIEQLIIDGREFDVQGDAGVVVRTAKYTAEMLPTGNGKSRIKRSRTMPGFNDCPIMINEDRGDSEFFDDILKNGETVKVTMTTAQLVTYEGDLFPVIDDSFGKTINEGVATLSMAGESYEQI